MNEAAAQLTFRKPILLMRRDELFPLARQVVRDSGYQYSKGHSRSQFQVLLVFFCHFGFKNISSSFQSGSQNDLVDSWRDESSEATGVSSQTTSEAIAGANARWNTPPAPTSQRHLSAEYPFHKNLCMPPQGINFDLTHKRG